MKYVDIHAHSSFFPFAQKRGLADNIRSDLWTQIPYNHKDRATYLPRFSQADFSSLIKGNVKILFNALYPIEQGWFRKIKSKFYSTSLSKFVTKFPRQRIKHILSDNYNYFEELIQEYNFLLSFNNTSKQINGKEFFVAIPKNKQQLISFLKDDKSLIVIPAIEGITSLVNGNDKALKNITFEDIKENILKIKQLEYPIFYITFAHHFYNGFSGHARSIFESDNFLQKVIINLIDQNFMINEGINSEGIKVIKCLLSIDEFSDCGRRLLIDAKHFSPKARKVFYQIINSFNTKNPQNKIPIIFSHSAFSGFSSLNALHIVENLFRNNYKNSYIFNPSGINLTCEDVLNIYQSEGLIGISLEEKLIAGFQIAEQGKKLIKQNASIDKIRLFWAKQLVRNIISMVDSLYNSLNNPSEKIWSIFAIGSDFDGFIDPIDGFISAEEFPFLEKYLITAFEQHPSFGKLSFGLSAQDIVKKILFDNPVNFLLKNFPD